MDTVFIVRPFGKNRPVIKKTKEGNPEIVFYDFDRVEAELITPAINALKLEGGTTLKIFETGEIKEDMFSQLLTADIVIADITIHNANVFYELGIRHALRCKTTVLIKGSGFDETPFDIIGYRYIDYQKDNPSAALDTLIRFLKDSPVSEKKDSPVFNMLPKLKEQEIERFLSVPPDFSEEVRIAAQSRRLGNLLLLASEAEFFPWQIPALRFIGEEMFKLKALEAGSIIWEKIKAEEADDFQANDRLATIYQRLAHKQMTQNESLALTLLAKSDLAIESLLKNYGELDINKRSEIYSLKGRNAKARWINAWKNSDPATRSEDAFQSPLLEKAFKNYESGYYENLNHFYSGINALALLTIRIELAELHQDLWLNNFSTDEEAEQKLKELKEKKQKLSVALEFSLQAEKRRLEAAGQTNIWVSITEADYNCLMSSRPQRVALLYKQVLQNAQDFEVEAATNQLKIYQQLNVLTANVEAALNAIRTVEEGQAEVKKHYLLFTGHMIDKKDRQEPRFPAEKESIVKRKIVEAVEKEKSKIDGPILGIAGGACGGDILFHEVCQEFGIPTELYLALPPEKFKAESVAFAGNDWIDRFDKLYRSLPHHTLCNTKELPAWLQKKEDYTIWKRNNLWELNSALVNGGIQMTLIALWDGKKGDGAGGTEHMVLEAQARGAKIIIIDINSL